MLSETATFAAGLGPLLVAVIVYVTVDPAGALAGPVLTVTTSALAANVVVTVAVGLLPLLLPGLGSGVVEVLLAVLATVPLAGTAKLTVLLALAALSREAIALQVTIPVAGL
jgi:hypothetical protein